MTQHSRMKWRPALAAATRILVVPALLVLALAGAAVPASAQIVRLGFVDSQRIFESYRGAQDAQDRFTREITAWRTDADDRRRALDALRGELKDQEALLSEAKKLERETAVQRAVADYDRFVQEFWGPGGRVQRLNDEMTREVIGKIRDAVETIANREGYDLVLDAADGNVIFGVKSLDLTDRVLAELAKDPAAAPR
jgi:Skp family chaperone for outer membrane proteins